MATEKIKKPGFSFKGVAKFFDPIFRWGASLSSKEKRAEASRKTTTVANRDSPKGDASNSNRRSAALDKSHRP
jgi:hypothetical protein